MIATLVREQMFHFKPNESNTFVFNAEIKDILSSEPDDGNKFEKFKRAFNCAHNNKEWSLTAEFNWIQLQNELEQFATFNISLKGEILQAVHQQLYHGDENANLRLECRVKHYRRSPYNGRAGNGVCAIEAKYFQAKKQQQDWHTWYAHRSLSAKPIIANYQDGDIFHISVGVDVSEYFCLADVIPRSSGTNKKIFTERKFCDLDIICDDGTIIPCHKAFLCAQSTELSAHLEGDFKEKKENKLKIADMSAEGVNALLEFIYCDHVYAAIKCCGIAMELLIAADKYQMPVLWKAIAYILMQKSSSWFDIDVALSLFSFLNKCPKEETKPLKGKIIEVLAEKRNVLADSETYKEMFSNEVTREMFKMTLEGYNKSC